MNRTTPDEGAAVTLSPAARRGTGALLMMLLPGPDRRRALSPYSFRVTYRNPSPGDDGCVMTWSVTGGRLPYQVALERAGGDLRWHCSCADAVYRGEDDPKHACKHVRGLVDSLPTVTPPVARLSAA